MILKKIEKYRNILPDNESDLAVKEMKQVMIEQGFNKDCINSMLFSQEATKKALLYLGINNETAFYEYYLDGFDYPEIMKGEELYSLEQILENYKFQSWLNLFPEDKLLKQKYPFAGKRYIQISSIEGEGSYFYDKQTDCVYDVNWGDEEAMITGELQSWFTSFYDFLEWYYSEDN